MRLDDVRLTNFTGSTLARTTCEFDGPFQNAEWNAAEFEKLVKHAYTFERGGGIFEVSGDAGSGILDLKAEDSMPPRKHSCGYTYPGYIDRYWSGAHRFHGGVSKIDICFSSADAVITDKTRPDAKKEVGDYCDIHKSGYAINCVDHMRYQLPTVTEYDLQRRIGQYYIKVALMDVSMTAHKTDAAGAAQRKLLGGGLLEEGVIRCKYQTWDGRVKDAFPRQFKKGKRGEGDWIHEGNYERLSKEVLEFNSMPLMNARAKDWFQCGMFDQKKETHKKTDESKCTSKGSECAESMLFPRSTFKISELVQRCQGALEALHEDNEFQCCRTGGAGKWCLYINTHNDDRDWNSRVDKKSFVDPHHRLQVDGARPCDFGYCTDGEKPGTMPPPPPPWKNPPMPERPPKPPVVEEEDVEDDYLPEYPPPSPPPSPPPPPPTRATYQVREGPCRKYSVNETKMVFDAIPFIKPHCNAIDNEVLAGFGFESGGCAKGKMNMASICATIAKLYDAEGECYDKRTGLIKVDEEGIEALSDLGEDTVQCMPKHALMSFEFLKDPRPWYVRRDNPGRARITAKCCPLPHVRMCSQRKTECRFDAKAGFRELSDATFTCHANNDEVLTGFDFTKEGCPAGKLRVVLSCCSAQPPYMENLTDVNQTTIYDESALEELEGGDGTEAVIPAERAAPHEFAVPSSEEGPVLDAVIVEQGASAFPRAAAASRAALQSPSWPMDAHDAIPGTPVCARGFDQDDGTFAKLAVSLQGCESFGSGARRTHYHGNKFIKLSGSFTTAFEGPWSLRLETHAFRGKEGGAG